MEKMENKGNHHNYKMFMCFNRKFQINEAKPPFDVVEAFSLYAEKGTHMNASQLRRFLVEFQAEDEAAFSEEYVNRLLDEVLHRRRHLVKLTKQALSLDDFFSFLFSDDLNGPINTLVHQDMTAPLQHYFIYTGHNSYLTGNQLSSDCSDVPIIKSLQRGVRVIELDLWPSSSKDNINVLHGRTLTTPVTLFKCLKSIKEYAFTASPYPVIITLEDHLTPDLQAKVAKMVIEVFGEMLHRPESADLDQFPSPEELKYKVILSTKPPIENLEDKHNKDKGSSSPTQLGDEAQPNEIADEGNITDQDEEESGNKSRQPSDSISGQPSDSISGQPSDSISGLESDSISGQESASKSGQESASKSGQESANKKSGQESANKSDQESDSKSGQESDMKSCQESDSKSSQESHSKSCQESESDSKSGQESDGKSVHEVCNKSGQPAAPEYNSLIAIHAGKPKNGVRDALMTGLEKLKRLSLNEEELERAATNYGHEVVRFTQKNFLRIYPKGTRIRSSNYKPLIGWSHGAQMIAFNMQGYGKSLWLMHGMFRSNGGCGYVKKPDLLMSKGPNDEVFDPKVPSEVKKGLKIRVYMGDGWRLDFKKTHFDTFSPPDFYVKLHMLGVPADFAQHKTKVIEDDWAPVWDQEFEFHLTVPELALLLIEVREYDMSEKDDFGGQTCLPVPELKPGIRAIHLFDRKGEKLPSVRLLMKFQII